MTPYLHNQVIDTLKNNKVTEEKWSQLIEPLKTGCHKGFRVYR